MSASLVGSEMCIRDRRGFVELDLVPPPLPTLGPLPSLSEWWKGSLELGCLLYTSDAADDM
eukprot:3853334-Alexandrium_andersonii.AAC.1